MNWWILVWKEIRFYHQRSHSGLQRPDPILDYRDLIPSWTSLFLLSVCIISVGGLLLWLLVGFVSITTNRHDHMIKLKTSVSWDRWDQHGLSSRPCLRPPASVCTTLCVPQFEFFYLCERKQSFCEKKYFQSAGIPQQNPEEPGEPTQQEVTRQRVTAFHTAAGRTSDKHVGTKRVTASNLNLEDD